jgi:RNA polymerase sigma-70 factor (ECF subfamily)
MDGHMTDLREAELLIRISKGEEAAFRELFTLYQPGLLFIVDKITRNMAAAEEVVQDIFLKIWQTRETLEGIKSFKNYLFVISRNKALKLIEKEIRERNRQENYHNDTQTGGYSVQEDERPFHLIDEAIERLPAQQKTAWLLSRHEGLTYVQIAAQMELSEKTVKRHIRLATDSMKVYISTHNAALLVLLIAANYL